jgi:aspartyl/asparaginyl beta-hydroxylase (cupin superfamily)
MPAATGNTPAQQVNMRLFRLEFLAMQVMNRFVDIWAGGERRAVSFDIDQVRPELRRLEQNWTVIRREAEGILPDLKDVPRYHDLDPGQYRISSTEAGADWRVFMLNAYGEFPPRNRALCPETCRLIDAIPGVIVAFFSILDPGKSVPAHRGPLRTYLRYHLGIVTPRRDPPTIRVKDEYHTWEEGRSYFFDDSWEHEVINQSDGVRVVLIVDVVRPLPWPARLVNEFFSHKLIRWTYGRSIAAKLR